MSYAPVGLSGTALPPVISASFNHVFLSIRAHFCQADSNRVANKRQNKCTLMLYIMMHASSPSGSIGLSVEHRDVSKMAASGIQEHNEARRKETFIMRRAHLKRANVRIERRVLILCNICSWNSH